MSEAEIYCPQCKWRPSAEDRWECMPSCGTIWNTFWTRGVCPGCAYHWRDTQCIACGKLSPHESWYHYREPAEEHAVESGDALQALYVTNSDAALQRKQSSLSSASFLAYL